ncbi:MAG: AzlC family ABC transporter permease [Coriobacteriia bacterium]|nr:AzlC family ABC transporter permease [Coriobacteriia bacterium]
MSTPSYITQEQKSTQRVTGLSRVGDRSDFFRGIKLGLPIFLGYLPVGLAFGILAARQGFSPLEALLCSATALAGAGQFIALATLLAGGNALTTVIAAGIVNSRYVLFAATVSPHLKKVSLKVMTWLGFTLTDESFAINIADLRSDTATQSSMGGVGLIAWIGWVAGTGIGVTCSSWIGDPSRWGIDFAMPAMFAALFVTLAENREHILTGVFSGCIVIALALLNHFGTAIDSNWFIVIAALAGATAAAFIFPHEQATESGEEITVVAHKEPF